MIPDLIQWFNRKKHDSKYRSIYSVTLFGNYAKWTGNFTFSVLPILNYTISTNTMDEQEEVYKEYLNYDWDSFDDFQLGLQEILSNYLELLKERDALATAIPPGERALLIDQAKSFFFCSQTGHILNLDDFEQWKRDGGYKFDKSTKISEIKEDDNPTTTTTANETPYSSNYQELVELIVSGKPVPGIKDIPDTVLSDQKSESKASQRLKPWEKKPEESEAINE